MPSTSRPSSELRLPEQAQPADLHRLGVLPPDDERPCRAGRSRGSLWPRAPSGPPVSAGIARRGITPDAEATAPERGGLGAFAPRLVEERQRRALERAPSTRPPTRRRGAPRSAWVVVFSIRPRRLSVQVYVDARGGAVCFGLSTSSAHHLVVGDLEARRRAPGGGRRSAGARRRARAAPRARSLPQRTPSLYSRAASVTVFAAE